MFENLIFKVANLIFLKKNCSEMQKISYAFIQYTLSFQSINLHCQNAITFPIEHKSINWG